jgi:hypothetical protein
VPSADVLQLARDRGTEQAVARRRDQHLILDAHAEALLGHVDAGLHGEDRAHRQGRLVVAGVVHVEAHEVAEAVDEVLQVAGAFQGPLGGALQVGHRHTRLDGGQDVLLGLVDRAVGLGLLGRELAADREGAGDVGGVAAVLRSGVDHHQLALAQQPGVVVPVQDRAVRAAAHDGAVGEAGGPARRERILDLPLHVALAGACHGGPGGRLVALPGDRHGLLQQRQLLGAVGLAQAGQQRALVDQLQAQPLGQALAGLLVRPRLVEGAWGRDQGHALRVEPGRDGRPVGPAALDAVDPVARLQRRADRVPRTGPAFALRVAWRQEQGGAVVLQAGRQQQPGVGLVDAGQPQEIAVLTVGVPGGAAVRGEQGDAAAQLLHHPLAPGLVDRSRDLGRRSGHGDRGGRRVRGSGGDLAGEQDDQRDNAHGLPP